MLLVIDTFLKYNYKVYINAKALILCRSEPHYVTTKRTLLQNKANWITCSIYISSKCKFNHQFKFTLARSSWDENWPVVWTMIVLIEFDPKWNLQSKRPMLFRQDSFFPIKRFIWIYMHSTVLFVMVLKGLVESHFHCTI